MAVRSVAMGFLGVAVMMLGLSVSVLAQQPAPAAPAAAAPAAAAPAARAQAQTLQRNMAAMNRAFRTINTSVKDKTKNEATLAAVVQLQTATLAAKGQLPEEVEKATGEDKTKKAAEYRGMMAKLLAAEADLETNLIAGDNEKAAASFDKIKEIQAAGHKEFKPAS